MPRTSNSSYQAQVAIPNEVFEALKTIATADGKGTSWHFRQAVIEYVRRHGFSVSGYNPTGRGVRSDLLTPNEILESVKPPKRNRDA